MRHGEVHNPERVLYGRLPGYRLSVDGRRMARQSAEYIKSLERPIGALVCSPLQRTRESAEPFVELFGIEPFIDERVIEPTNVFEGKNMKRAVANPLNWRHLVRPSVPSWGEPYREVVDRMQAAMADAWTRTRHGDVVVVSHQLPIWIFHLAVLQGPLSPRPLDPALGRRAEPPAAWAQHNPAKRRCALSSVTSFEGGPGSWVEVAYAEPAVTAGAVDVGAV